ncbi:hypothetical protein GYA54_02680 [Candidatus Kuenenbacteria bacterium]|nr:hypothetical protein [Candidatus Kuenenbacteria bacterium]
MNNKKPILNKLLSNQGGIALVLTVLILANLLMITFIVADVILRIGKTSRAIGESESAYFAAESAMEKAIYKIEKERDGSELGTEGTPASGFLDNNIISWKSYLKPIKKLGSVICFDNSNITSVFTYGSVADVTDSSKGGNKNCIYTETLNSDIVKNNPLKVRLQPGRSFEIDFGVSVPTGLVFYPDSIDIDWPAQKEGRIIVLHKNEGGGVEQDAPIYTKHIPSDPGTLPASSHRNLDIISGSQFLAPRIRIINDETNNAVIYELNPSIAGDIFMPIGIEVTAKGYYNNQKERIIISDRKNWKIY